MTTCSYCGKDVEGLPHKCKFCRKIHCSKHLLPESHNCMGLNKYKEKNLKRWKEVFISAPHKNRKYKHKSEHKNLLPEPDKTLKKIKYYFFNKFDEFRNWLNQRKHNRYNYRRRFNYLVKIFLIFITAIVAFNVFYSNAQKLNEINLWIIKLGGVLILTSLFFVLKFGWRLGKEGINILKRQKNWLKYLIIILIVFLLWQGYKNKDTIFNPFFEIYNKTNFSLFTPLNVDMGNFNFIIGSGNNTGDSSGVSDYIRGVIDPKSQIDIYELEFEVHRLINVERINKGLKPLNWDERIAQIAREHSKDMVNRNFFSHDNPEGKDPTDRGNNHGYYCRKDYGSYYTYGLAENIAQTPIHSNVLGCGSTTTLKTLANCIVDGWMKSAGHRENILTNTYTETGIGIAFSERDIAYSTQNFC